MTVIKKESSCLVQAQWEWATSADSGRWGDEFQAYRYRVPYAFNLGGIGEVFNYGYSVITTRNKIRGKGRAISFKFSTEPYRDCQLLGWNMDVGQNQEP